MKVLDIGFGNGYLDALIYRKEQCTIYGIDISEDMVKLASEKNQKGIENGDIHFAVGDCCDLAFENQAFDIVVTMNTIYFWNDTIKGLQEIYRVLKDGGVFYNAVLKKENLDKLFYKKMDLRNLRNMNTPKWERKLVSIKYPSRILEITDCLSYMKSN
ncbi:MAG: class I SAM-dependent methyltransferase, partial [Lachnospiraceae bacterium]|nr:class I SAM-dependent methyltransferase [Lachnospiraceae bacterium]